MSPTEPFALPPEFASRMALQLGVAYEPFTQALRQPTPVSLRFNPAKVAGPLPPAGWAFGGFNGGTPLPLSPLPWCPSAAYLPERPVFALDPAWHAGTYYVQEASSMLVGLAVAAYRQLYPNEPLRALDLCAAPGGKTTLLASLLDDNTDVLVANEAVQSRMGLLLENLMRWGAPNVIALQHDPDTLAQAGLQFDLVLADAPCSGEGLWRRDPNAINEWSPQAVVHCAARQRRVLDAALQMVRPGGLLLYSTCTYAPEENELNIKHLLAKNAGLLSVLPLDVRATWGLTTKDVGALHPAYAALPHRVRGEGFFCCLLQKSPDAEVAPAPAGGRAAGGRRGGKAAAARPPAKPADYAPLQTYVKTPADAVWVGHEGRWWLQPAAVAELLAEWPERLHISRSGVEVGAVKGRDALPAHPLCMSTRLLAADCPALALDLLQALSYLRGNEPQHSHAPKPGWYRITYNDQNLGWLKHLGNRSNNYYPKNYRLRLQSDT